MKLTKAALIELIRKEMQGIGKEDADYAIYMNKMLHRISKDMQKLSHRIEGVEKFLGMKGLGKKPKERRRTPKIPKSGPLI